MWEARSVAAILAPFRHQAEPVAAGGAPPTLNQVLSVIISISVPNVNAEDEARQRR